MSGAVELRECPFCGSDEIEGVIEETVRTWCARCGCDGPVDGSEQGVTWNTRAPDPAVAALEAEVARLRGWLRDLEPHLDALICYASSMDEYPPNRTVSEILKYLSALNPAPSEKEAG